MLGIAIVGVVCVVLVFLFILFILGGRAKGPVDRRVPLIADSTAQVEIVTNVPVTLAVPSPGMRVCLRYVVQLRRFSGGSEPFGLIATVRGCGVEHERLLGVDANATGKLPVWGKELLRFGKRNGNERTESVVVAIATAPGDVTIELAACDGTALISGSAFLLQP
jgi:hypothetical protein